MRNFIFLMTALLWVIPDTSDAGVLLTGSDSSYVIAEAVSSDWQSPISEEDSLEQRSVDCDCLSIMLSGSTPLSGFAISEQLHYEINVSPQGSIGIENSQDLVGIADCLFKPV